ncbi:MAG: barstar family protein [Candidatus Melainabacteria bacterium]|nr:barstar family protein [Candidatus Melainabacteria bacterium]
MADTFNAVDMWNRLDYQLLQHGAVSLYFSQDILQEDCAWLKKHGYKVRGLDASNWTTEAAFHDDVKRILEFPGYYGNNINAFNDCLGDIEIGKGGGFVIAILHFDRFYSALPDRAQAVLDIIETNSRRFLITGQRLLCLIQTDNPRTQYTHLGCITPRWNPREFMDRNRGL